MDHLVCQKASKANTVSHIVCSLLDLILQGLIQVLLPHKALAAPSHSISWKVKWGKRAEKGEENLELE